MSRASSAADDVAARLRSRRAAGQWLQKLRRATGLTQAELAARVGLRYYAFVSQVEGGLSRLPVALQAAWACALGVEIGVFSRKLLMWYEPELHRLLFDSDLAAGMPPGATELSRPAAAVR